MNKGMGRFSFVVVMIFGLASPASEIYPFYRNTRALGMGGASVAVVNDETALFLNPAGLGKIRVPYFALLNPELEINYNTNTALSVDNQYAAILDPEKLRTVAKSNPDKHLHARAQMLPSFVTTNFGIGLYGNYTIDSKYDSATSQYHLDYKNDYAAVLGYCLRLWEGRIKIGVSGKVVNRVEVSGDFADSTTNLQLKNIASEGYGFGWDAGIILTAPWAFLPSIAAVAHDIGDTKFNAGNGYFYKTGLVPNPQRQSVDVALAFFPIHAKQTRSR